MATVAGLRDFRLIMGDHHWTDAAWQDSAYLGEVIDDVMSEDALQPLIEGLWRLFGVEDPPKPQR